MLRMFHSETCPAIPHRPKHFPHNYPSVQLPPSQSSDYPRFVVRFPPPNPRAATPRIRSRRRQNDRHIVGIAHSRNGILLRNPWHLRRGGFLRGSPWIEICYLPGNRQARRCVRGRGNDVSRWLPRPGPNEARRMLALAHAPGVFAKLYQTTRIALKNGTGNPPA